MNYRHAYHAGSFADVFKHAVLTLILAYLKLKPGAFRVIDTHAGAGVYDLSGPEASRTGEWQAGIGRLLRTSLPAPADELIAPYLDLVRACNPHGNIAVYPGSPALVRAMLRPQDRLIAYELHPHAYAALTRALAGDARTTAKAMDGWAALSAFVPPKERRGLVIIDPPFEEKEEFERIVLALKSAHRRWATGTYLIWYPMKDRRDTERFVRGLGLLGIGKILRTELFVDRVAAGSRLAGAGLIIVNPPWMLYDHLACLTPALAKALALKTPAQATRLQWISPEG
jgi:23S rRNA (adenine2030-N6)-methyltransferase